MYRIAGCVILSVMACGCSAARGKPDLNSDDPSLKIPAIQKAVGQNDLTHIQEMVHDLNCDDSAVRFYAIQGLERLTGETMGYRYYDDEEQREPAVKKWNDWLAKRDK